MAVVIVMTTDLKKSKMLLRPRGTTLVLAIFEVGGRRHRHRHRPQKIKNAPETERNNFGFGHF